MLHASRQVNEAFSLLLRAHDYADEAALDPWRFAVEWRSLKALGLAETDVRWLVARNLVEFRREISVPAAFERVFVPHDVPRLSHDTAFVLTPAGWAFCRSLSEFAEPAATAATPHHAPIAPSSTTASQPPPTTSDSSPRAATSTTAAKPHWDPDRRELTFAGQLVKSYRVPSPNQELILSAFQEEDWPSFVDDPLPPVDDLEPHRRLQATVKSLNRRQVNNLIRFRGNGGMKVFWQVVT